MAQAKKFGTFGGVFTPSILTILGVIMYLRLGWVVGEAGLYSTLVLILIAHVISVSTGLSLSSIATDKKIKTGGIYFMLSRSLGLPMGGSIGITLFLGTALSIALYIVGFVENFLSIEVIQTFLGMDGSVNDIRIIGTGVIILLVLLAYISTSFAIKTQYFILGAIALSLVSIVVGIFINPEFQSAAPALMPSKGSPNLIVIFAVFFPAVTGFTAGVAMSGDLKNPKDSIPKGTLMSIGVGLIVYIALAFLFAFYIDRDLLLSDTNFLQKIAWISPLVIAGIWGATLSSALGGILGAPRILQAMSGDKVTHRFFAKGVGDSNEPRRALILTFVLAEVGILIGELDVIAGIVSMFYIAAYGFINLAYVLERWANSDFRPSLKISIWVGIIGFIASIGVMLKLDTLGMLFAFGIMFGIYIYLKRKEVQGNMTDVWQSVWTSIIRTSLHRVNQKPLNETNWQPNIILFSGGGNVRPHLLYFGVNIVGTQGFLSNFDLFVKNESDSHFPKSKQKVAATVDDEYVGVFTRRQSVSDIYEGIEIIAQTYGFSGVEPNTVMMGWARQSSDPKRFTEMIYNLGRLDMNVLLIDYDKERAWGKKQSIDIWWRGGRNNGNLALSLVKFITSSEDWAQAKIRLLIVNPHNDLSASIYETTSHVLEGLRIDAELRIINNEMEQRSFYDIIKIESVETDLIFLGLPQIEIGKEEEFVKHTNALCHDIGTVVITQASSQFKDLNFGELKPFMNADSESVIEKNLDGIENIQQSLDIVHQPKLAHAIQPLTFDLGELSKTLTTQLITPVFDQQTDWLKQLQQSSIKSFDNIISRAPNNQVSSFKKSLGVQHQIFMRSQLQFIKENILGAYEQMMNKNLPVVLAEAKLFERKIPLYPYRVKIKLSKAKLDHVSKDNKKFNSSVLKLKPLFWFSSEIPYSVYLRELMLTHYPQSVYQIMYRLVVMINKDSYQFANDVFKAMRNISGIFENTKELCTGCVPSEDELRNQQNQISEIIKNLIHQRNASLVDIVRNFKQLIVDDLDHLILQLNYPIPNAFINHSADLPSLVKKKKKAFIKAVETSGSNKELVDHVNELNLLLLSFRYGTQDILYDLGKRLENTITDSFSKPLKDLLEILDNSGLNKDDSDKKVIVEKIKNIKFNSELRVQQSFVDQYNYSLKKIKTAIQQFPEQLTIYTDSMMFTEGVSELQPLKSIDVALRRTLDFMVERAVNEIHEMIVKEGQDLNILKAEFTEIIQSISMITTDDKNAMSEYVKNLDSKLEYHEIIALSLDKAKILEESIKLKQEQISGVLLKKIEGLKVNSELYPFIRNLGGLKQYIREEKTKNWFNWISNAQKSVNVFVSNQLNKLWYNQSSGLILAQKLSKSVLEPETRVESLLNFKEKVTPSSAILNKIPDYYKQLFLRKRFYLNEFWVGREEELAVFNHSFSQWKAGYAGGIMVLGERNSGKSFFANYLSQNIDNKGETFFINPPYAGSDSVDDLLYSFQEATDMSGSFAHIFNHVPPKSVFFIDDMELWWEKRADGMNAIKQLMTIINRFGKQHLFVVMSNIYSFNLINKYQKLESNFLSLIELRPFNAKQLKNIIIRRHQASSLDFVMNNIPQNRYRSWNYARLFSRYFSYSEGNPGVALQAWINSIEDANSSTIILKKPRNPDAALLGFLETEWMIFMMHFLLHKRMTRVKLMRVSQESRAEVIKKIRVLKRAGLIISIGDDILDIDPYILPFIRKALVKQELI